MLLCGMFDIIQPKCTESVNCKHIFKFSEEYLTEWKLFMFGEKQVENDEMVHLHKSAS